MAVCSLQYFHGCLCQRCVVSVQSLYFMGGLSFAVWWNVEPRLCDSLGEKLRCVVLLLKSCLSRGMLVFTAAFGVIVVGCTLFFDQSCGCCKGRCEICCQQMPLCNRDYLLYACFEAWPNFFPLNKTAIKNEYTKQVVTANILWLSFRSNWADARCKAQPACTELC